MAFEDKFVAEILALQVSLYHSRARLDLRTDGDALHDLRIAVRRIRSLLRPMRGISEVTALNDATAAVGRLTTPTRDLEVMIQELESRSFTAQAQLRKGKLAASYSEILKSSALSNLFIQLDLWPPAFRSGEANGDLKDAKPQIEKALKKQIHRLHTAVDDAGFDRHELRILVKRTRYLTEAFPKLSPLSRNAANSLKALQSALGDWHDHYQWCQKVQTESDLCPLEKVWLSCAATALDNAEIQLKKLAKLLPK